MKPLLIRFSKVVRGGVAISFWILLLATALPEFARAQAANEPLPVDGIWSLSFYFDTRPGGETIRQGRAIVSPYHAHLSATKESFTVNEEDGTFSWEGPNCGRMQNDFLTTFPEGTAEGWGDSRVTLKASGSVSRERALQVEVHYTSTEGLARTSSRGHWTLTAYSMSDNGASRIQSYTGTMDVPPPDTFPVTYLSTSWTLEPQSIEKQETSPDVIREVVTYEGRRNGRYGVETMSVPVVQRLRVKQIRHLKIVPRG